MVLCRHNVSALHDPQEEWQRAPLLERGGEPTGSRGRVVQRQVLYLGEINDSQREAWRKTIEVFEEERKRRRRWRCFPRIVPLRSTIDQVVQDSAEGGGAASAAAMGCLLVGVYIVGAVGLDKFWAERLPPSRKGTRWDLIVQALAVIG